MEFLDTYFKKKPTGILVKFGDQIYLAPEGARFFEGVKSASTGTAPWYCKKEPV